MKAKQVVAVILISASTAVATMWGYNHVTGGKTYLYAVVVGFLFFLIGLFVLMRVPEERSARLFFLLCVIVAAIYGGITAKRSILLVQGGPALLALLAVLAR